MCVRILVWELVSSQQNAIETSSQEAVRFGMLNRRCFLWDGSVSVLDGTSLFLPGFTTQTCSCFPTVGHCDML